MKASIVDLRYKMKEVLRALRRKESVHILYHGKTAGTILPPGSKKMQKVAVHPFFGMSSGEEGQTTVEQEIERLRGKRHRDL